MRRGRLASFVRRARHNLVPGLSAESQLFSNSKILRSFLLGSGLLSRLGRRQLPGHVPNPTLNSDPAASGAVLSLRQFHLLGSHHLQCGGAG